ncbi:MAG: DUF835 domain-containing protein, partial [Candidatus Thermoplasmatota archaeon]
MAREGVRRVQQMRKDVDLAVEDYVRTAIQVPEGLVALLEPWREYIGGETRTRTLVVGTGAVDEEYIVEWPNVDGATLLIGITPLHIREALDAFTRVPGITERKAMALFDSGYKTLPSLADASRDELLQIEGVEEVDVRHLREFLEHGEAEAGPPPCPVCGAAGRPGELRCWRCGETPPGTLPCPACGTPIPKGTYACPACGFGRAAPAEPVKPEPAPAPVAAPEVARVEAAIPEKLPTPSIQPAASSTYLVMENRPLQSYALFLDAVHRGRKGFCVTRVYPAKVREKYGLGEDVPILWLSNVGKEDSVRPKDLEKLSLALEQFITKEQGFILLDGI